MEKTLILIKPDGSHRTRIGEIICRFEKKGLKLIAARMLKISDELAARHYAVHKGKDFYDRLIKYITSGPTLAMVWQGEEAIFISRKLIGATFGNDAESGTIRGDFSMGSFNIIHGSDCAESAEYEIPLYFKPDEMVDYELANSQWIK